MIINVLNYQYGISDNEIEKSIKNFTRYLNNNDIPCDDIQFVYNDSNIRLKIDELIKVHNDGRPLLENFYFQLGINELCNEQVKVVLIGISNEIVLKNPWGDAWDIIAIIRKPSEKVIWHEIAHLIGANDHYDENRENILKCKSNDCIMRYGMEEGIMCEESLNEIKEHLLAKYKD